MADNGYIPAFWTPDPFRRKPFPTNPRTPCTRPAAGGNSKVRCRRQAWRPSITTVRSEETKMLLMLLTTNARKKIHISRFCQKEKEKKSTTSTDTNYTD